ncbi:MAG: chemotaxis protein CheB, partial [Planctomycetota bacterium]
MARQQLVSQAGDEQPVAQGKSPYVVGIGASAGGLQPLQEFFGSMPQDSGLAFVIVQHLSPEFKSLMNELLSQHTNMAMHRVEHGMPLEPNSIYLIPPKKNLSVSDDKLVLTDQDLTRGHPLNFPIDIFFISLAGSLGERAMGVILSGTGSDGTRGVRAINEVGGVVLVQDPDSAEFDGMPRSVIATGLADYVLPPRELARAIYEYATNAPGGVIQTATETPSETILRKITALIARDQRVDFSQYKPSTLGRRIERRRVISGCCSVEAYVDLLEESEEERAALRKDLLINVTAYFRDPEAWSYLEREIVPRLIAETKESDELRIWVTACSTGEEAYSLAMLVQEAMETAGKSLDVKIFATDIDDTALQKAAAGVYPEGISEDVSPQRVARFFKKQGHSYHVIRQLREMMIFAVHNLTRDPPLTRMQLVTCRNLLIYMQPQLQQQVLSTLHFALKTKGVLFLGSAETVGDLQVEFSTLQQKWRMFEKKREVRLPLFQQTKASLQATIEEMATTNEAQLVTNQEMVVSNEEMQSTNEELQSVNEELYSVNAELQSKIGELIALNNDMNNLLESTNIGTVFLDKQLRIRKFTPAVTRVIKLLDHDVGRPLDQISFGIEMEHDELLERVRRVLESGKHAECGVKTRRGAALLLRINPYRDEAGRTDGVVLTFVDISELKRAELQSRVLQTLMHAISTSPDFETAMESTLASVCQMFGWDYAEAWLPRSGDGVLECCSTFMLSPDLEPFRDVRRILKLAADVGLPGRVWSSKKPQWALDLVKEAESIPHAEVAADVGLTAGMGVPVVVPAKAGLKSAFGMPILNESAVEVILTFFMRTKPRERDLTSAINLLSPVGLQLGTVVQRKRMDTSLREAYEELQLKNQELEQFVHTVSHDLKSPLVTIGGVLGMLKEELQEGRLVDVGELIATGEDTVDRMQGLIDDLLKLSRLGRAVSELQAVELQPLIEDLIRSHQAELDRQRVTVELTLDV